MSEVFPAGYGNGGIDSMDQFIKLSDKISNSLRNLEHTRDMLRQLADNERKSAKQIATILNQKNKSLRFSVVDRAIQNYWKKQESNRRNLATALQTKIIEQLDSYINSARDRKQKLRKENSKIQRNFIECKKETTEQKITALRKWEKLEETIRKNDQYRKTNKLNKIKDLKPFQDRCSTEFAKYESYVAKLNELEQVNHEQSCKIGEILHESQKHAADRLSMHFNMAVSSKTFLTDFIHSNKSIVQSKAPPLNDILWRWLTFPKNHKLNQLPCTFGEVYFKNHIDQRFRRNIESEYQNSAFLKPPKRDKKGKKSEKIKKVKKPKNETEEMKQEQKQQQQESLLDNNWEVDFGGDNDNNNGAGNIMSGQDFFGSLGGRFGDNYNKENNDNSTSNITTKAKQDNDFGFSDDGGFSALFADGNVDIFSDGGGGNVELNDDEFDDEQPFEFPEFDVDATPKSIIKKKKKESLQKTEAAEAVKPNDGKDDLFGTVWKESMKSMETMTMKSNVAGNDEPQKQTENKDTKYEELFIKLENEVLQKTAQNEKYKTLLQIKSDDIELLENRLDETTQANMRQRNTILQLQSSLNGKNEEEEKNDDDGKKGLHKILMDLNGEIGSFKQNYTEKKLQEIFNKSPKELIQNDSKINKNMNEYHNNTENIILSSKSFNKYIDDLQSFIKKISVPDIKEYKTWNLEQMIIWIISLENGKYRKYAEKLKEGFIKSQILSGDLLPEIRRSDLSVQPFNINEFIVKRDLEQHFKSLKTGNIMPYSDKNIEGFQTQYIDK